MHLRYRPLTGVLFLFSLSLGLVSLAPLAGAFAAEVDFFDPSAAKASKELTVGYF